MLLIGEKKKKARAKQEKKNKDLTCKTVSSVLLNGSLQSQKKKTVENIGGRGGRPLCKCSSIMTLYVEYSQQEISYKGRLIQVYNSGNSKNINSLALGM